MIQRWIFTALLCIYSSMLMAKTADISNQLVIADEKGDWGLLAPYLHIAKGSGYLYTSFVFDTLVWKNQQGEMVPMLASSWGHDAAHQCYLFTMNSTATWHDGKPLTAQDVVFSFQYMKSHFYPYVDLHGIEKVSAHGNQVTVCSTKPDALFVERIAGALPILPKHIYQAVDDPKHFTSAEAMIGSGPYKLKNYNKAQGFYLLERNDNWYLGQPKYQKVIVTKLSSQAAANAMKQGKVDIATVPYNYVDLFEKSNAKILKIQSNHPYRLLFNHKKRFDKVSLRQGMAYALDKEQLVTLAFQGQAIVARPAYSQDKPSDGLNLYQYDPDKAAVLLKENGWLKNSNGHWIDEHGDNIQLNVIAPASMPLLAKVIVSQLTQFGFNVSLKLLQDIPLLQSIASDDFDLALLTQSHQGGMDRFRIMVTGKQQRGDHYLADPKLTHLLNEIRYLTNTAEREEKFKQAELMYNYDLPSLPLVNPIAFSAVNPNVSASFTKNGIAMGIPTILNKKTLFLQEK